jgi:DNA-binding CsgD family transcriptional regulator
MTPQFPILTYAGTSGHSPADTSQARAQYLDASGITGSVQAIAYEAVVAAGYMGMTQKEIAACANLSNRTVSSALTNLHKSGHLARLSQARSGSKIYIHPREIDGRQTENPGAHHCPGCRCGES